MDIIETVRVAFESLIVNKMRSVLTMLGVVIGVGAVILLVSIGQGAKTYVTREISDLGSNLLFILPGRVEFGQGEPTFTNKLTVKDIKLIERRATFVKGVAGLIENQATIKYKNDSRRIRVNGVTANYPEVIKSPTLRGRFIDESQVLGVRKVCTLGQTVVDDLFGSIDPIGEKVLLGGQRFTVIGVMEEKGSSLGQDMDDLVYVPITTAQRVFGTDRVSVILVSAPSAELVRRSASQIEAILSKKFSENDFSVQSQKEALQTLQRVLGILTLMLGGIAGISLLVGGIGIMNIMLVSVTERTREIGIRKAVGARTYDIMLQFIIEAIILSLLGGSVGIGFGMGGSLLVGKFLPSQVTPWSIFLAFSFSAAVGIFFGVYPAYKASRLDPIQALRYE